MNVPLLRQIQERILAEPEHFRMDVWSCGTAHCFGGWACVLNGIRSTGWDGTFTDDGESTYDTATRLLALRGDNSERFFLLSNWPFPFNEQYGAAATPAARARVAADRIDWFIRTNGEE